MHRLVALSLRVATGRPHALRLDDAVPDAHGEDCLGRSRCALVPRVSVPRNTKGTQSQDEGPTVNSLGGSHLDSRRGRTRLDAHGAGPGDQGIPASASLSRHGQEWAHWYRERCDRWSARNGFRRAVGVRSRCPGGGHTSRICEAPPSSGSSVRSGRPRDPDHHESASQLVDA